MYHYYLFEKYPQIYSVKFGANEENSHYNKGNCIGNSIQFALNSRGLYFSV